MNNPMPTPNPMRMQPPANALDRLAQEQSKPEETTEFEPVIIVFDSSSPAYMQGLDAYNLKFVQDAATAMDHSLQQRGHLFLNELNDYLKVKRTPEGQLLGWISNDDSPGRINISVEKDGDVIRAMPNVQGLIQPFI